MKEKLKTAVLLAMLYLCIFQFPLQNTFPLFQITDELLAVLFVPLVCWHVIRKKAVIQKLVGQLVLLVGGMVGVGLLGNAFSGVQELKPILMDAFLMIKFFLACGTGWLVFEDVTPTQERLLLGNVKVITASLFLWLLADKCLEIFPVYEERYGMNSEQLIFGHPTGLASVSFFLAMVLCCYVEKDAAAKYFMVLALLLTGSSLRQKAILAVICFVVIFVLAIPLRIKFRLSYILPVIPIGLLITHRQLKFYFFSPGSLKMARGALAYTSLEIFRDNFPLGTGFATFGSWYSGVFYSPLYQQYGIDRVPGIALGDSGFVADNFWPMLLAQLGMLGALLFIVALALIIRQNQTMYKINRAGYTAVWGCLVYLLISSMAESAFTNPLAIPFALWIGFVLGKEKEGKEKNVQGATGNSANSNIQSCRSLK